VVTRQDADGGRQAAELELDEIDCPPRRQACVEEITGDHHQVEVAIERKVYDVRERLADLLAMSRALLSEEAEGCTQLKVGRVQYLGHAAYLG
jgi:hypothetical protein